jgi:hypothetical protein
VRQEWNITKYREWVRFNRCHITSLCSMSMAFHCWTTRYYLWTFFMQTTLIFYLYKKLWRIVWTTFPDKFNIQDGITLTDIEHTQLDDPWLDGLNMFCWWICMHLVGEIGGKNMKLSLIPGWYISCNGHPKTPFWEGILCSASATLQILFGQAEHLNSWLYYTDSMMHGCTCPSIEYSHNIPKIVLQGLTLYIYIYIYVSVLPKLVNRKINSLSPVCPLLKGWLIPVLRQCCCTKSLLLVIISSKYILFHDAALLLWESLQKRTVLWA